MFLPLCVCLLSPSPIPPPLGLSSSSALRLSSLGLNGFTATSTWLIPRLRARNQMTLLQRHWRKGRSSLDLIRVSGAPGLFVSSASHSGGPRSSTRFSSASLAGGQWLSPCTSVPRSWPAAGPPAHPISGRCGGSQLPLGSKASSHQSSVFHQRFWTLKTLLLC